MRKKANNFGRFYVLAKKNPAIDKESMVLQFTDGRTTHLREMYQDEYNEMCDALEFGPGGVRESEFERRRRKLRSAALLRIGRLGINTVDNWDGINAFCLSPKIAGKEFGRLSLEELDTLIKKLEIIIKKGGLKVLDQNEQTPQASQPKRLYIPMSVPGKSKYMS